MLVNNPQSYKYAVNNRVFNLDPEYIPLQHIEEIANHVGNPIRGKHSEVSPLLPNTRMRQYYNQISVLELAETMSEANIITLCKNVGREDFVHAKARP